MGRSSHVAQRNFTGNHLWPHLLHQGAEVHYGEERRNDILRPPDVTEGLVPLGLVVAAVVLVAEAALVLAVVRRATIPRSVCTVFHTSEMTRLRVPAIANGIDGHTKVSENYVCLLQQNRSNLSNFRFF